MSESTQVPKVNPPEKFSFVAEDWNGWIRQYDRYRRVSGLTKLSNDEQIDHLIYSMGEAGADDIFDTFQFANEADKKKTTTR